MSSVRLWAQLSETQVGRTMPEPGPPLVVMRGKVTLEVVWRETVCEEALLGGGGGEGERRVQPVLLLRAAASASSSSIGGGYTTVPLGELAGLF